MESLPDLIVIPYAIENRNPDLEQLQLLGKAATELQIPVLISASPAFFQLDTGAEMDAMPLLSHLLVIASRDSGVAISCILRIR